MAINSLKSLPPIGRAFFSKWLEKINEIISGVNSADEQFDPEKQGSLANTVAGMEDQFDPEVEGSLANTVSGIEEQFDPNTEGTLANTVDGVVDEIGTDDTADTILGRITALENSSGGTLSFTNKGFTPPNSNGIAHGGAYVCDQNKHTICYSISFNELTNKTAESDNTIKLCDRFTIENVTYSIAREVICSYVTVDGKLASDYTVMSNNSGYFLVVPNNYDPQTVTTIVVILRGINLYGY